MKPKFIPLYFLNKIQLALVILFFVACTDEEPVPLTTNSAIYGYVYDYFGQNLEATITATGPYGKTSVVSEDEGYFFIGNLGNGTYDLEFAKSGYGIRKAFGVQLFGNDTVYAGQFNLYEKYSDLVLPPLLEITDSRELQGLSTEAIVIRTSWKRDLPPARFFIGFDEKVDFSNFEHTMPAGQLIRTGENGRLFMLNYFYTLPLESGTKVYLVAYVCNSYDEGYLDLSTGKLVFPTLVENTKSNVLTFEIP